MECCSLESIFSEIDDNYKRIRERIAEAAIKSGRKEDEIRFMAVTKTVPPAMICHAISLGIDLIGENKVQELLSKEEDLPPNVEKHIIGHLQTNKVTKAISAASMIQSVDSLHLAEQIDKASQRLGKVTPVLLEINIGSEESKSGFPLDGFIENIYNISLYKNLKVCGLMTIPPVCETPDEARKFFSATRKLFVDIGAENIDNIDMQILSMGMSADYYEAILEGATLVRVGSALFGNRRY